MSRKKKIFTEEEIKYIIDNWKKESAYSMKKNLIVLGMLCVKLQKNIV